MNTGVQICQWTVGAAAKDTYVQVGFVPDFIMVILGHSETAPDFLWWVNKATRSQWLDADDHLLQQGSDGVISRVTTGIAKYDGGDLISTTETKDSDPVHPYPDGTFPVAGAITGAGFYMPAALLDNDDLMMAICWRLDASGNIPVRALATES